MSSFDVNSKGTERAAPPEMALTATGLEILGALRTGIVCVLPDWTITAINGAAADALASTEASVIGADFWSTFPALHDGRGQEQILQTMRDGTPRVYHAALPGGPADATHEIRLARTRAGWLVVELREWVHHVRDTASEETEPLRELARQMAAGADSEALLSVLCDATTTLTSADGAAIVRLADQDGVVVTASGAEAPAAGTVCRIADSLAGNALRSRSLLVERDDPDLAFPTAPDDGASDVGETAVAPLVAADQPVGVLAAWRLCDSPSFSQRDRQRLRVIADHAAVVLVKARLLEEAQAATLAKSNFLATISHELRTPLTALTGYGELLADEIMGPLTPHQRDMVERVRSVTHQLAVMVDEILTYSALEAGRETVRPAEVSIIEVLDAALTVVEPLARQKELELKVDIARPCPSLYTDPDKVRQILVNLMGNAVKFTDHGRVDVAAVRQNGQLRVDVRDTGIGIADHDRARLFQPFTQLDAGLTRRHGGTGLGLYNSQRLAALLGGRIEVESAPGQGSKFSLILPARFAAY